jgi:hypothetical protein
MDAITQAVWDRKYSERFPGEPEGWREKYQEARIKLMGCAVVPPERTTMVDVCREINNYWPMHRFECLDLFERHYNADIWRATDALRNGDLLIDF